MIPLPVVMLDVLGNRSAEMTFAERDHPIEALVLDRAYEPFGIGIALLQRLHRTGDGECRRLAQARHREAETDRDARPPHGPRLTDASRGVGFRAAAPLCLFCRGDAIRFWRVT